jgi:chemotaxis protein CheX
MATVQVKVEHINPFVEAVYELFTTMLGTTVERGDIALLGKNVAPLEVMGIIGLSGETRGVVTVGFPGETALKAVSKILDTELTELDDEVSDGVAEIVNMIAGNAKAKLSNTTGTPIDLSLPTVVRGTDYRIDSPGDSVWIGVPFDSPLGNFELRVMFEPDSQA